MKQTYIITYTLFRPGQNYAGLLARIKEFGTWARIGESVYMISTDWNPVQIRDYLWQVMTPNDQIYVGRASAPAAWNGLADEVSNWILTNQR